MKLRSFGRCSFGGGAVLCALAFGLSPVRATDEADAMQTLVAAVRKEAAEQKAKTPADDDETSPYRGRGDMGEMLLQQLRAAVDSGEPQTLDSQLEQFSVYYKSDAVRAACVKLRDDLHRERQARDQAMIQQCRDAIDDAGKAVKSAATPADLDPALHALGALGQQPEYRASESVRAAFNRVQGARRFVTGWQDYLAARGHGDTQSATQALQNLSSSSGDPDMLPRSEILARIEELKTSKQRSLDDRAAEIVNRTKTLDDIAASVFALKALQNQGGNDYSSRNTIGGFVTELQSLGGIYNNYQAGMPTTAESLLNRQIGSDDPAPALLNLREQLLRLVCARQLDVEDKFKPGAQESIQDYLKRVMADAQARCDVRLIVRVRGLQTRADAWTHYSPVQSYSPAEVNLQSLLAAQNQEEAGQYIPAVVSYQRALKTGGELVPAKSIGARLDAIKTAHPAEYEKGMEISLHEPAAAGSR